ncbi:MAG: hypothetical protein ACKOXB_08750 [Flavobacteriales bacterium]
MILLYLFTLAMVIIALGKMRKTWYYMAKMEDKTPPLWVRATGKMVWFITAVFSLEIFD